MYVLLNVVTLENIKKQGLPLKALSRYSSCLLHLLLHRGEALLNTVKFVLWSRCYLIPTLLIHDIEDLLLMIQSLVEQAGKVLPYLRVGTFQNAAGQHAGSQFVLIEENTHPFHIFSHFNSSLLHAAAFGYQRSRGLDPLTVLITHILHQALDLRIGAFTHGVLTGFLDSFKDLAGVLQIQEFPGGKSSH